MCIRDSVWAVNEAGNIARWSGTAWTLEQNLPAPPEGAAFFTSVAGTAANDVWVAGRQLLHYDGAAWSAVPTQPYVSLLGVWPAGRNDVWAVGQGGLILRGP